MELGQLPMPVQHRPTLADLSPAQLDEMLRGPCVAADQTEREHPELAWMRARSADAIAHLQAKGILDAAGNLTRPDYLPEDMLPTSKTEC